MLAIGSKIKNHGYCCVIIAVQIQFASFGNFPFFAKSVGKMQGFENQFFVFVLWIRISHFFPIFFPRKEVKNPHVLPKCIMKYSTTKYTKATQSSQFNGITIALPTGNKLRFYFRFLPVVEVFRGT
jgi:hypothetical protein